MKKLLCVLLTVVVASAVVFAGCFLNSAKQAENKLIEKGEFVADSRYGTDSALSVKSDKTYSLYDYSYETEAMKTYEGTWSHVMTYKFKYTVTHGITEIVKTTESVTWNIFILEGCLDRGQQGYFILKEFGGILYYTDEEINESHFEQYKNEYGLVSVPGCVMKVAAK